MEFKTRNHKKEDKVLKTVCTQLKLTFEMIVIYFTQCVQITLFLLFQFQIIYFLVKIELHTLSVWP